ncbi:rac GTPase-activating protein 1-like [Ischnura elegans]|uniref:rac GTPase-activating protein 1-like n=1 Tax=Ischnura elegans TaxID=197161 RepID=UPI001ED87048|nr:rac GTPase-activating protein 1-like [Ischnura elegans]
MVEEGLSLGALFDDIIRLQNILIDGSEQEFLRFVINQEECRLQWCAAVEECKRLQAALAKSQKEMSASENKIQSARRMLDQERKRRRRIELENQALERQMALIRDLLVPQQNQLNEETKEKLALLNSTVKNTRNSRAGLDDDRLKTITEFDTTGSILSDLSFSRSEDDLDNSFLRSGKKWKSQRPSLDSGEAQAAKRRRSSSSSSKSRKVEAVAEGGHVIATTTVRVSREGPVNATCTIETGRDKENKRKAAQLPPSTVTRPSAPTINEILSQENGYCKNQPLPPPQKLQGRRQLPPPPHIVSMYGYSDSDEKSGLSTKTKGRQSGGGWCAPDIGIAFEASKRINSRQHCFSEKTVLKSEECTPCGKRINFGKVALKCSDCKVVCHAECKEEVTLPCVPSGGTPNIKKGQKASIADYAPMSAPMIPSIVIHCVNEIESRGLNEVGIYRVPGSEREVKFLKEKFMRGKGAPNLHGYDIHVVCGVLKDFLRNLSEPLITRVLWQDFGRAAEVTDSEDSVALLYEAIAELPKPNRDTLAYIILHLQKVASCRECKMPAANLAKVFGPTVFGYSGTDVSPAEMYNETRIQHLVIEALMRIPSEYWSSFINPDGDAPCTPQSRIPFGTPSTENGRTPLTKEMCGTGAQDSKKPPKSTEERNSSSSSLFSSARTLPRPCFPWPLRS